MPQEDLIREIEKIRKRLNLQEEKVDYSLRELELLRDLSTNNLLATIELRQNLDRLSEEFRAFQKEMQEFKDEMREFKEEMREFKDEMREYRETARREMEEFKREMNRKWGDLANRLGTIAEDIFAPGMPYLVKQLGYEVRKQMVDVTYRQDGRVRQYDALVVSEDRDGRPVIFVAEVKSKARAEDLEGLREALEDLLEFEPDFKGARVIPVLAAFRFPEGMETAATKRGVLLVRMGGEYLEALNPEVV